MNTTKQEYVQLKDIHSTVHHLDRRVTVLETRADAQAEAIKSIQTDVRENKNLSMQILGILRDDAKGRAKCEWWIVATLVAVIATLVITVAGL